MEAIYNGSNSFRVFNNVTSEFGVGRRVKMDCGLDGLKYASVVSSSYSSPYTTVQIDESDLTASLTDVWYAVVTAGPEGSIPNHAHNDSEGSGGTISGTTYSGIDDHEHAAYVPWDFGSGTISGTGDIHCNDIYTASGTVYIGDLKLSTDGTNLLVDDQPIEAIGGGEGGSTTFSGLTDTPNDYDDGKFLRSTSSGTEWATVSGSPDEFVPWNFGAGTISGTGDIYCNDIYTSSGTVYIGDIQLTTSGGGLLVDGQTVSDGQDGAIWIVASGTPNSEIGNPHDMYLNQANYDIYQQQDIGIEYDPVKTNIPSMTHDESITFQGPPSVVSDGNENTYWQINNTTNQWVSIDLGSSEPVYKVLLEGLTGSSDRFVKNFRVEASYNNSDWDIIYTGLTVQNTSPQEFTFSALSAAYRYWRLYAIDNWGGSYLTVTRFELYAVIYLQNYDWVQTGNIKGEAGDSAPTTVSGIILIAPNSSEWLLQVTNSGTLYTTEVV